MADLAFGLELLRDLKSIAAAELLIVVSGQRVQQVEVEIFDAAGLQLAFQERADILLFVEEAVAQFVGQQVAVPRVTAGQAGAHGLLAQTAQVAVRGVKIAETACDEIVHHTADLVGVHAVGGAVFAGDHRQAHHAETELFGAEQGYIHGEHPFSLQIPRRFRRAARSAAGCAAQPKGDRPNSPLRTVR